MKRVFHRKFMIVAKCIITLLSLLAFYFMWIKLVIAGVIVILTVIMMIERLIHTTYTFSVKSGIEVLTICRGRFSKPVIIPLYEIITCTRMKAPIGASTFLAIEYGADSFISVQPDNEEGFISELNKRQK